MYFKQYISKYVKKISLHRHFKGVSKHRRMVDQGKMTPMVSSTEGQIFYLGPPCEWEILPKGRVAKPFLNGHARDIGMKPFSMEMNGQDCGDCGEIISFLRRRSSKSRHGCVWRLSPEGHVEFWGDRSLWKESMAVFLQWIQSSFELECPTLERYMYI